MFEAGICIENNDPDGNARIRVRTARLNSKSGWVLPMFGGPMRLPVPRVGEHIWLFYSSDTYENPFYVPGPTKEDVGEDVGDRRSRADGTNEAFEVDLGSSVGLHMDADADTANLDATEVVIGTVAGSTEFIVMATKLKDWIVGEINDQLKNLNVPTGVGPSGPASSGTYQTGNPVQNPSESDIASGKHKVEA